jgi:hypothetical protein
MTKSRGIIRPAHQWSDADITTLKMRYADARNNKSLRVFFKSKTKSNVAFVKRWTNFKFSHFNHLFNEEKAILS